MANLHLTALSCRSNYCECLSLPFDRRLGCTVYSRVQVCATDRSGFMLILDSDIRPKQHSASTLFHKGTYCVRSSLMSITPYVFYLTLGRTLCDKITAHQRRELDAVGTTHPFNAADTGMRGYLFLIHQSRCSQLI